MLLGGKESIQTHNFKHMIAQIWGNISFLKLEEKEKPNKTSEIENEHNQFNGNFESFLQWVL